MCIRDRPTSFTELEELADKAKEAGVTLCMAQIQYPGSDFQYVCNIAVSYTHLSKGKD